MARHHARRATDGLAASLLRTARLSSRTTGDRNRPLTRRRRRSRERRSSAVPPVRARARALRS
jgi:hypothetical protein